MKKLINFIKDKKIYILNIAIILIIFFSACYIKDVYPFSGRTLAESDALMQYQPMLYNFIEKIRTGLLETYSFNNGFGAATTFNFVYYLSSPLNILSIIFKTPNSMYLFNILLRIVLTGIISLFYFKKKTNNNFVSLICSLAYTFCGWFITYHSFTIWLDIYMIFPLFHYGLEQLIENNKCKIYIFTLSFILITNFYLAFAVCLYTLVYYFYRSFQKKEKYFYRIRSFQIILFSTIIACLLSCFHLYLVYDSFIKIGILKGNIINLFERDIPNTISGIFYGQFNYLKTNSGITFPNISLNSIFIMSFIYYYFNKNITLKEKIKTTLITIFFIFIIFSETADFIINCFHTTVGFTYRYSFILCFLMILLFVRNYQTFDYKISKKIYIINIILLALLIFLYYQNIITLKIVMLNIAAILCYSIFFIFYDKNNKYYKYIIVFLMIIESVIVLSNQIILQSDYEEKTEPFKTYKYRQTEAPKLTLVNKNLYANKNDISQFTSMNYKSFNNITLYLDMGTDGANILIINNPSTVFKMFFNIQNEYYLEKVFAVNEDFKDITLDGDTLIFDEMIKLSTGFENTLIQQEPSSFSDEQIIYDITEDGIYRLNFTSTCTYDIIDTNNPNDSNVIGINSLVHTAQTLHLKEGFQIRIKDFDKDVNPLNLYIENHDVIKKAYEKLSSNQINYYYYSDSHMEGKINVDKDQVIFTSIPYDKDWEVRIDGKKVNTYKIFHSFMGFDCEEGTHEITLTYKPNYIVPALISITTLISLITHEIIKRKKQKDTKTI